MKGVEKALPDAVARLREICGAQPGDLLALVAGPAQLEKSATRADYGVFMAAGQFRVELALKYAERHMAFRQGGYHLVWVTDFPMFEYDAAQKRWNAAHHPFTSPNEKDIDK